MRKWLASALAAMVFATILVVGLSQTASATDPIRQLQRRVSRLENQVATLNNTVDTLRQDLDDAIGSGTVNCLSSIDVTQYDDYESVDGGSISGLDRTESGDTVDWRVAYFSC